MPRLYTVRGLPGSIATDGWWLDMPPGTSGPPGGKAGTGAGLVGSGGGHRPAFTLVVLILIADLLFWNHDLGLSLAIFAAAVFAAAVVDVRPRRELVRPALMLVLGALPVIEHVQPLSLVFLGAALPGALVLARFPAGGVDVLARGTARHLARLPLYGLRALVSALPAAWRGAGVDRQAGSHIAARMRDWALPVGGTLVFAALLAEANPLIDRALSFDIDPIALIRRGMFWFGTGLMIWPLLHSATLDPGPFNTPTRQARLPGVGINAKSSLRALWMFNVLIGVQTVSDLSVFVGGASLPQGMTYAAYAHRGAYPLLATALLAGVFALAARPYLGEHRLLKPLMLVWLGQNVALSLSAALRLEIYVEVYGLTYLRIRAMIWMGLVAAGLALTAWQVWRARSNRWLVVRSAAMGVATLYLCSFVNFAAIIARENLDRWPRVDLDYVCALGPTAAGAIDDARRRSPEMAVLLDRNGCNTSPPPVGNWREWGFRNWRIARYLAASDETEPDA